MAVTLSCGTRRPPSFKPTLGATINPSHPCALGLKLCLLFNEQAKTPIAINAAAPAISGTLASSAFSPHGIMGKRPMHTLEARAHPPPIPSFAYIWASKCFMSADLEWVELYREALNEADSGKRPTRIEEAARSLKQVLRHAVEMGDSDQRRAISEALHELGVLKKGLEEERR
jgi:hypothetical protein